MTTLYTGSFRVIHTSNPAPFSKAVIRDNPKEKHRFLELCESYFAFRNLYHLSEDRPLTDRKIEKLNSNDVSINQVTVEKIPWHLSFLKVLSLFTGVVPLIALIGKIAYRRQVPLERKQLFILDTSSNLPCLQDVKNDTFQFDNIFVRAFKKDDSRKIFEDDGELKFADSWMKEILPDLDKYTNLFISRFQTTNEYQETIKNQRDVHDGITLRNVKDYTRDKTVIFSEFWTKIPGQIKRTKINPRS